MIKSLVMITTALVLSGCVASVWQTDYKDIVTPQQSLSWRISEIDVQVPETLVVSEANSYGPDADIVWREEPLGDRYEQVDRIITEAAQRGSMGLKGRIPVKLNIVVYEFHALTERARQRLTVSGVHNIQFTIQVVDPKTGNALTELDIVQADLEAFVGEEAILAEQDGLTQRVRIVDHVSKVIAGWLGVGPDVRHSFKRIGR